MSATHVRVLTEDGHQHRSLNTILEIFDKSRLTTAIKSRASAIFQKLGEAEALVHDVPIEKIHFHEVGAVDAIVDIVGACIGFSTLGIESFACSALNVGGGTAKMAHGVLPVPAPATARLLLGKPTYSNGTLKELVTPTGAAIIVTVCDSFGPQPAMSVSAIGYGAGKRDIETQPNVMRLMIGEATDKDVSLGDEIIRVLEANLDDMNPQIYGYFLEKALGAGALDVFATPVQMKKNRPGFLITILCSPESESKFQEMLFAETTTLGSSQHHRPSAYPSREWVSVYSPNSARFA